MPVKKLAVATLPKSAFNVKRLPVTPNTFVLSFHVNLLVPSITFALLYNNSLGDELIGAVYALAVIVSASTLPWNVVAITLPAAEKLPLVFAFNNVPTLVMFG